MCDLRQARCCGTCKFRDKDGDIEVFGGTMVVCLKHPEHNEEEQRRVLCSDLNFCSDLRSDRVCDDFEYSEDDK